MRTRTPRNGSTQWKASNKTEIVCPLSNCGFTILTIQVGERNLRRALYSHLRRKHFELGIRERSLLADEVSAHVIRIDL